MTRVLLINSDRTEPAELLRDIPDIELCVITKARYRRLYPDAEVAEVPDVADLTRVGEAALRLARGGWFDAVISPLERGLMGAGLVRSQLGVEGLSFDQSLGFASKLVMKRRISGAGLPVAAYRVAPDLEAVLPAGQDLGWPVIVKSSVGAGAQHTVRLDSPEHALRADLRTLAEQPSPILVERALSVRTEFHCDAVVQDGTVLFASVSRYLEPVLDCFGGFLGSVILPDDDPARAAVLKLNADAVAALGLRDGVTHLEAFDTPDGLVFGEVTCRPGGGGILAAIRAKYGIDLWEAFVTVQLGRPFEARQTIDPRRIGWLGLPGRNGRVTGLTDVRTLRGLPGVVDVGLKYHVGDVVEEKITSVFLAGIVQFAADTDSDVASIAQGIAAAYTIRTAGRPVSKSDDSLSS